MADGFIRVEEDGAGKRVLTEVLDTDKHSGRNVIQDPTTLAAKAKVANTEPGASDYGVVARLAGATPAGENGIGSVGLNEALDPTNDEVATAATASQAGGTTAAVVVATGTGFDAQVLKDAPGRVYSIEFINLATAALGWVKFYDKATNPVPSTDGALLRWQVFVPMSVAGQPSRNNFHVFSKGLAFANGIALVITKNALGGETSVDAEAVFGNVEFK